jgi:cysteinyl-tRNA synthetase
MFSLLTPFRKAKVPKVPLRVHNTLTGTLDEFQSLKPGVVKMYNCGPTVYDFQHIGNMRAAVFANTLRRVLEFNGYEVKQVINITDVGHLLGDNDGDASVGKDRLELGAERRGLKVQDVAAEVTEAYFNDLDLLNIKRSAISFPRATHYINEQIALVATLIEKGYAYVIADGVYFDTKRFKSYGELGNINLKGLEEGARVEKVEGRKNPTDFALWKLSKPDEKRQQEWDSPWGVGFPGWHIECTAMIFKLLGRQIDIHTGGIEHIPIHHNNEIAQAEAVSDRQYAQYWLHNDHLLVDGKKISKSIGNTIYLRNLVDRGFSPLSFRYLLLTAHYKSQINFTWESLEAAHTALTKLQRYFLDELRNAKHGAPSETYMKRFVHAINEDLNTAKALAVTWELIKDAEVDAKTKRATLLQFDAVLGIGLGKLTTIPDSALKLREIKSEDIPEDVQKLISDREQARTEQRWLDADRIRADLRDMGYELEDSSEGPRVEKRKI